jgi:hypothetical protein
VAKEAVRGLAALHRRTAPSFLRAGRNGCGTGRGAGAEALRVLAARPFEAQGKLKACSPGLKSGASTDRKDTQAEAYATNPSAPKGGIDFARLTARPFEAQGKLKPCPDTKPTTDSVLDEFITGLVR